MAMTNMISPTAEMAQDVKIPKSEVTTAKAAIAGQ